jgi:hypothetical protein
MSLYLVSQCEHCAALIDVLRLPGYRIPHFAQETYVVLVCPHCGKETCSESSVLQPHSHSMNGRHAEEE